MSGPFLWYLNRGTGVVLLVLFTATVVLGLLSVSRRPGVRRVPQFFVQGLHRAVSGMATALLLVHVISAVLDTKDAHGLYRRFGFAEPSQDYLERASRRP